MKPWIKLVPQHQQEIVAKENSEKVANKQIFSQLCQNITRWKHTRAKNNN